MTLDDLLQQTASWLEGSGPHSDVVISSRVRMARNFRETPFLTLTTADDEERVVERTLEAAGATPSLREAGFFDLSDFGEGDRRLLVERHLISPALALRVSHNGVLVGPHESYSVMINEEDHLRLQALMPGFDVQAAWEKANTIDTELGSHIEFAFDDEFGYLTACPTNTGTGLRASILIHLPGLVLLQTVDQVIRGINQVGLTVRGFYGEGTDVVGSLFQISNQTTLGKSEPDILETLERVVRQVIDYEQDARQTLLHDARDQIEDKVHRAYGILSYASVMSGQEFMNLSSAVRLGLGLGLLGRPEARQLNELMVRVQPSHVQRLSGSVLDSEQRDYHRAKMVRERFHNGGRPD